MPIVDRRFQRYLKNVPVMPEVATRIISLTGESVDEVSFKELEEVIKIDPGLSTKLLKIANSALYSRQREITNIQTAITLLGLENLKSLVLLVATSNRLTDRGRSTFYRRFWTHAVHSAFMSRHMCLRGGMTEWAEEAFTGALLHDIGQIAFYNTDPERYEELLARAAAGRPSQTARPSESRVSLTELERDAYGIDHRELGASVFESWYFPQTFADMAREHGNLDLASEGKGLILTVSLADMITELLDLGFGTAREEQLDALLRISPIGEEDLAYYRGRYLDEVRNDPFFQHCRELFGIE